MPILILAANPFDLSERTVTRIPKNRRIKAMCPKTDFPVVCFLNGKPLLRAGWTRKVKHGDVVQFVVYPRGKDILRTVLLIVVAVVAWYAAPALLGYGYGAAGYAAAGAAGAGFSVALTGMAINMVGGMLINAMLPPSKLPSPQSEQSAAASPTYNIAAQGNMARVQQPIPVHYGRHIAYPDFAASPYTEYVDNDQYLFQLLVIGQGRYDVERIRIEDTAIEVFDGTQIEIIDPDTSVSRMRQKTINRLNPDLEIKTVVGPLIDVPVEKSCNKWIIDISFPGGKFGDFSAENAPDLSVSLLVEVRPVDDEGTPIGIWSAVSTIVVTSEKSENMRDMSYPVTVPSGRHEIRITRAIPPSTVKNVFNSLTWSGLTAIHQFLLPGTSPTIFPSAVIQSTEVSGAELGAIGPYSASGPDQLAESIGVDLVCPGGLYHLKDDGKMSKKSVTVKFEARLMDNEGNTVGDFFTLGTEKIEGATNTAIRRSYRYDVTPGRYQVKASRQDEKSSSNRDAHTVLWGAMRAYLPDDTDYGNITLLAVKLKASGELSQQASRKINCIATRKLPIWNPTSGWSALTSTRSIAWALADICRANYGAKLADDRYDLAMLYALDQVWTLRGDTFDGRFDGKQTVWEALTNVARAGRAKPYQQSGMVRFWRDSPQTLPKAIFQPRNIKAGSFSMEFSPAVMDSADAVRVSYFDERYWQQRDALCYTGGSAAASPAEVQAFGMVQRRQAVAEGMYMAACNRYRRRVVTFTTEAEGLIPRFGDLIGLNHDMPSWGQSGDVIGWDADSLTAALSEPPTWQEGVQHFIALVRSNGRPATPIQVSKGLYDNTVVLSSAPDFTPETAGYTRERTRYVFGTAGKLYTEALILRITPKEALEVEIQAVVEDPRVHTADQSTVPDSSVGILPTLPSAPNVPWITVSEGGTPSAPIQFVSWGNAPGADQYWLEYTTDDNNWSRAASTTATSASIVGIPAGQYLNIRVAGVGMVRGPWKSWLGTSGATVSIPNPIIDLALDSPFTGLDCRIRWTPPARADRYRVQVYAGGAMRREQIITECAYSYGIAEAAMDGGPWRTLEFRVLPLGVGAAESEATISATNEQVGQLNNIQVVSDAQGAIWSCSPPGDVDLVGFKVWASQSSGFALSLGNLKYDGSSPIRQLPLEANRTWYVRCGAYDVWGDDAMNVSGEFIVTTGAIGASHISVASLSAIIANLGEIIAGRMHSADNTVDFDLDEQRLRVLDGGGAERLQLGLIGTDQYGLRVSNPSTGRSVVFSPDIGTVIAQGQATMPTTLNADETYSLPIALDKEYNFADLVVIVDIDEKPALYVAASWTSLTTGGATIREFHAHLAPGATYKERDGNTAAGRAKYKSHTVSNTGREFNALIESSVYSRWDKGSATSGSTIHISAAKTLGVYDRTDDAIKNLIEISWPVVVNYAVIAKNYQG